MSHGLLVGLVAQRKSPAAKAFDSCASPLLDADYVVLIPADLIMFIRLVVFRPGSSPGIPINGCDASSCHGLVLCPVLDVLLWR